MKRVALCTFLFITTLVALTLGRYAQAAANLYGDIGIAWNLPNAPISLTRVYSYLTSFPSYANTVTPLWTNDCILFENGPMAVAAEQFAFTTIDDSGKPAAAPIFFNVNERLSPGDVRNDLDSYCKSYGYGKTKSRRVVGWVNAVTMEDGSTWYAIPPIPGTVKTDSGSPVRLSAAFVALPPRECVSFKNASGKTVTRVRLEFAHNDTAGEMQASDVLDVRSAVPPGAEVHNTCRDFRPTSEPDIAQYAYLLADGLGSAVKPTIVYAGKPTQLAVTVDEVDFADGTSWHRF